jgi:hypothetical protein
MVRRVTVAGVAIGIHFLTGGFHGIPHVAIPVELAAWQWAFVVGIANLAPIVGFGLAWQGRVRTGGAVLAVSMGAALVFGVYHHYLVANPNNIVAVPAGQWKLSFMVTAAGVALTDTIGVLAGVGLWLGISDDRRTGLAR